MIPTWVRVLLSPALVMRCLSITKFSDDKFNLMIYGTMTQPLLLKDVVPWRGWSFGWVEPKMIFTRASDRAVKGVLKAHWDVVVSPE